ncbi:short-chain dehydrogenase/reductase [Planotetraspora thailandica]|uniref:Short-chain dehydrogenase/reductase n=1 Tax=Planotetraspora thailandica TaxID=487172 RepID=A0A8J3XXR6_9ACTN|nr:oxidoreductase [Planotetraspora thailandica]GII56301.1 short-chain dehydrogenase/reductase [Planotetraspora thailandica]
MKTWLITGGTSGFGQAYAEAALEQGDQVVLTARNVERLETWARDREKTVLVLPLDVTDPAQVASAVDAAQNRFGAIDVLVNNAGGGSHGAVEDTGEAVIRSTFEVNFFGTVAMIRAVLPRMRARRSGCIVNISSVGGVRAFPGVGYYNAAKFAVEGISESLRQEVEPLGIKVLVVEPGAFRTKADSAGYSAGTTRVLDDYAHTVGALSEALVAMNGKQPGDPRRAARAVVQAVASDDPPHHLVLGSLGFDQVTAKLETMLAQIRAWEDVARGADFPDSTHKPGAYV